MLVHSVLNSGYLFAPLKMSKPPTIPRPDSPCPSFLSQGSSVDSAADAERSGGSSIELQKLFGAFEDSSSFCQLDSSDGRGNRIVSETRGLLTYTWSNRDVTNPSACLDKHNGRQRMSIYDPPKRSKGGVMLPCMLSGNVPQVHGMVQNVSIVNNNVALSSTQLAPQFIQTMDQACKPSTRQKQQTQTTLRMSPAPRKCFAKKGGKGRFVRKSLVPIIDKRVIAPSIPLKTRSLRRLLKQWCEGDPERGLLKPLQAFTAEERNGRDVHGKQNKPLYSRRRTVAVAAMLALQDAYDNGKTFSEAIGIDLQDISAERATMCQWEQVAKKYLQKGSHRLTQNEICAMSRIVYRNDVLELLPQSG